MEAAASFAFAGPARPGPSRRAVRPLSPVYRRAPDAAERPLGEELFLVSGATRRIFHLEPTAATLWRLLAELASLAAVRRAFAEAFPEAEPDRIAADA